MKKAEINELIFNLDDEQAEIILSKLQEFEKINNKNEDFGIGSMTFNLFLYEHKIVQ